MQFDEYLKIDAVSNSVLKRVKDGLRGADDYLRNGMKETDAMRLGTACHSAVFEPDKFLAEYTVYAARRGTKAYKQFLEDNQGYFVLNATEYETATRVRDSVMAHPIASHLIKEGRPEVSIQWVHERTGLKCKGRVDWLGNTLVDGKSCVDVTQQTFLRTARRLSYAMQMAFYHDGVMAATGTDLPVDIVAFQKTPPYEVAVYPISDEVLAAGRAEYEAAIDKYFSVPVELWHQQWTHPEPIDTVPDQWIERPYETPMSLDDFDLTDSGLLVATR